jgi:hypothetical protein
MFIFLHKTDELKSSPISIVLESSEKEKKKWSNQTAKKEMW